MSRRRLVALVSAFVLLGVLFAAVAVVVSVTRTDYGREQIRRLLVDRVGAAMRGRGTIYIGRIGGGFLTGVTIDSVAIRDAEDSLFVAVGRVEVRYDPRDILDKRLLFRHLRVERPVVHFRRHADGVWNFRRIFPSGPPKPKSAQRGFGDFIVIDSAELVDAHVAVTQPWSPADSLTGARRDSAVKAKLAGWRCGPDFTAVADWLAAPCGSEVRMTSEGAKKTWRWHVHRALAGRVLIADPDTVGRRFRIARIDVDEPDPPFAFRNVRGDVRWIGDTLWFTVPHFDLPGSTGSARGNLRWGPGPMRYDIHVTGDSVSLADVAWVYPTLPRDGGGRMKLHIRNDRENRSILEYALTDMDVRSTRSHLVGDMTFAVGGPVLAVRDVDMRMDPVDFALLETFAGEPFPVPWRGQIRGTVRGRGGPLTEFVVDDARFSFADANVRGAVTRGRARGELDILSPALTVFHGFRVDLETLDLRTIRYLYPNFARLNGTVRGVATLDSLWTDVRFRDADLTHVDGPGVPTRATGSGHITVAEAVRFDVDLQLQPASLSMLARSYPIIPFRGAYTGPLRAVGTADSLLVQATLAGAGGILGFDGWVDADSVNGYATHGTITFAGADLRTLLPDSLEAPSTALNFTAVTAIRYDSLANMVGPVRIELARSSFDSLRIFPSVAQLAFGGGRMRVDTLMLETSAATVTARGALGVDPAVRDSLAFAVRVDSLGGLRDYLDRPPTRRGAESIAAADSALAESVRDSLVETLADSLSGSLAVEGMLLGSLDSVDARGTVQGDWLFVGGDEARRLRAIFALNDLRHAPSGAARLALDTVRVAGIRLTSAGAELALEDAGHGRLDLRAVSMTGPRLDAGLGWRRAADTLEIAVDTLVATVGEHAWALERPGRIVVDSSGLTMDTLVVANGGGSFAMAGRLPGTGPIDFRVELDSLDLADVAAIAQSRTPYDGWLSVQLAGTGTRAAPRMELSGELDSVRIGTSLHVPRAVVFGDYADRKLTAGFALFREGTPVLTGSGVAPIDLSLVPVEQRLLADPLDFRIDADSVALALLEAIAPAYMRDVRGTLATDILVGGTWRRPTIDGRFAIMDGEMELPRLGIQLREIDADIGFSRDSVNIRRLSAVSGERGGRASLTGGIDLPTASLGDYKNIGFDLRLAANDFLAIRTRRVAEAELTASLRLAGPFTAARLTGNVNVERGALFIPDAPAKQLVALDDPDFVTLIDTTDFESRQLLRAPSVVDTLVRYLSVENVNVTIGDDVWLRSREANVKLGGAVQVLKQESELALAGALSADRGDYVLDLGLVQRRFDVTQGRIAFYGEPGLNPALDIAASYTVRQADRPDVRIRAVIGGTLLQPRLTLTSDERIPLSTTEILSYLVFGAPSFALDQQGQNALRPVAQALLPTAGVLLEQQLRQLTGGFVDNISITPAGLSQQGTLSAQGTLNALFASRIGIGKQIGERTFVTANAGLCRLGGSGGGVSFAQTLGVSLEVRLNHGFSLQTGMEPATTDLLCGVGSSIISNPRQFGFDLFREWSF
jgi:translocation and assembly module TamB